MTAASNCIADGIAEAVIAGSDHQKYGSTMKFLPLLSAGILLTLTTAVAAAQDVVLIDGSAYGDIAVDETGNVYAALGDAVSKYDAALNLVWSRAGVDAVSIAVDALGSVYLGGGAQNVKFRPDGTFEKSFAAEAQITDMEVADGSLYATGLRRKSFDFWVARLDLDGDVIWSFSTPFSRESSYWEAYQLAPSLSVDGAGRTWVTGYFTGTVDFDPGEPSANLTSDGGNDVFVAMYDAAGSFVQAFSINGSGADVAHDIVADASGSIYVTGHFEGTVDFDPGPGVAELAAPACYDTFIAKYDAEGRFLWAIDIGGQDYCAEANGFSLAVDGSGGVYLTGYYFDHQGSQVDFDPGSQVAPLDFVGEEDAFVAKYDADGSYLWAFGLGSQYADYGLGLELVGDEDLYVFGSGHGLIDFNPGPDMHVMDARGSSFLARYTSTGALAIASSGERPPNSGPAAVRIYPNPLSEEATVELTLRRSSDVSVVVHDVLGREIARIHEGPLAAGMIHRFTIDGTDLANGVYVLRMDGVGLNASRLLLIQR